MVSSLLARFKGKAPAETDKKPKPDIKRVMDGWVERDRRASDQDDQPEQIRDWLRSDLDRLTNTMSEAIAKPEDSEARIAFESAIHNLFGASGAYGGGALTRLSGSLQRLVGNTEDLTDIAALINLHVKACIAAARSNSDKQAAAMSDAVCNALEAQVEAKLGEKPTDEPEFIEAS